MPFRSVVASTSARGTNSGAATFKNAFLASSVSSTQRPGPGSGDQFRLGSVVVGAGSNTEELSFQPGVKAYKPESYKVTDFSHQTTAQGHTYRCWVTSFYVFLSCLLFLS